MAITPLDEIDAPPSRASAPATYVTDMDAWLAAWPGTIAQFNNMISELNAGGGLAALGYEASVAWTPQFADAASGGTAASATVNGHYTKIGRLVLVSFDASSIVTTGLSSGSDMWCRGLPFASANNGSSRWSSVVHVTNGVTSTRDPHIYLQANASAFRFFQNVSGGPATPLPVSAFASGTAGLSCSFAYRAAS